MRLRFDLGEGAQVADDHGDDREHRHRRLPVRGQAGSACRNTRRNAPKAAALTPAAMRAVTVVGAPS